MECKRRVLGFHHLRRNFLHRIITWKPRHGKSHQKRITYINLHAPLPLSLSLCESIDHWTVNFQRKTKKNNKNYTNVYSKTRKVNRITMESGGKKYDKWKMMYGFFSFNTHFQFGWSPRGSRGPSTTNSEYSQGRPLVLHGKWQP